MPRSSLLLAAGALLLGSSCDDQLILRTFPLEPDVALPSGSSAFLGTSLRVSATGLEQLAATARYVVWAEASENQVALGELKAGQPFTIELAGALPPPASVTGVLLSEELTETSLPLVPGRVRLEGVAPGALEPVSVEKEALAAVAGEVRLENDRLSVRTSGLSLPGEGLQYTVWARFVPDEDCEAVEGGHVSLGTLDENGALVATLPYLLASMEQAVVTLESARGQPEAMSPVRVLSGHFVMPTPATSAESAPHSH